MINKIKQPNLHCISQPSIYIIDVCLHSSNGSTYINLSNNFSQTCSPFWGLFNSRYGQVENQEQPSQLCFASCGQSSNIRDHVNFCTAIIHSCYGFTMITAINTIREGMFSLSQWAQFSQHEQQEKSLYMMSGKQSQETMKVTLCFPAFYSIQTHS